MNDATISSQNLPKIRIGLALSDAALYKEDAGLPNDLIAFFDLYRQKFRTDELFFELQPEAPWVKQKGDFLYIADDENPWLKMGRAFEGAVGAGAFSQIKNALQGPGNITGVHQSIRDMDILAQDLHCKLKTIESTHQGMRFAHLIGADYFVFHLVQSRDYWDWDRSDQIAVALKAFQGWAAYYQEAGFTFTPLLENLEFPKFPATPEEMVSFFKICREFLPNLKLCFDIAHFWRSRALLLENRNRFEHLIPDFRLLEIPWIDYFDYALDHILVKEAGIDDGDIYLYHLGGCWKHFTHEIPGLRPGESPFSHNLRLNEPVYKYHPEREMNLTRALTHLVSYNLERRQDIRIVLEIYKRKYIEMLAAGWVIREDIQQKALQLAEKAFKLSYLWNSSI